MDWKINQRLLYTIVQILSCLEHVMSFVVHVDVGQNSKHSFQDQSYTSPKMHSTPFKCNQIKIFSYISKTSNKSQQNLKLF